MAKKSSTSQKRISEMMSILKISQTDIVNRTKIPKSSLSNYLSGKRTPNQDQLSVLADPYGINPAWLMGYDVPMYLNDLPMSFETSEEFELAWRRSGGGRHPIQLTDEEYDFIVEVRALHDPDFYKRMRAYMDLFRKRGDDNG